MTITGGSSLPKDEIDRMVKEAEAHAAEDKQRRELADEKNRAEAMVYSVRKSLDENKSKLDNGVVSDVEAKISALEEVSKGEDLTAIKTASSSVYASQQASTAGSQTSGESGSDDDTVEAEVVDDGE